MASPLEQPNLYSFYLSDDTADFFRASGLEIPGGVSFEYACTIALDKANLGAEYMRAEFAEFPGITSAFAFTAQFPDLVGDVLSDQPRDVRSNTMKVAVLSMAKALGEISTAVYEQNGLPLSEVTRTPGHELEHSSLGGDVPLALHQELARKSGQTARQAMTSYVVLGCVSPGAGSIPTNVSSTQEALSRLDVETKWHLSRNAYLMELFDLQKDMGGFEGSDPEPILEDGAIVADFDDMTPQDEEAQAAFDKLRAAANNGIITVTFAIGTIAVVNNALAWHGRGRIPHPHEGEEERLLLRAHVVESSSTYQDKFRALRRASLR